MIKKEIKHILFSILSAVMMAANINSFVNVAGLYPGGFSGVSLLVQRAGSSFWGVNLPYSVISYVLNLWPCCCATSIWEKSFWHTPAFPWS